MRADAVIRGRHYATGEPVCVTVKDGRIAAIAVEDANQGMGMEGAREGFESGCTLTRSDEATEDDLWIAPGLVDLQVNGYNGCDLNELSLGADGVKRMVERLWESGVTSLYPTIVTNSRSAIESLLQTVIKARLNPSIRASIPGIHLEGPYISPEDGPRGAHDKRFVRPPDWDEFLRWQDAAEGLIRLITLSPEWENAPEFTRRCVQSGVKVAIGHTAATTKQIEAAVAAGATLSTHLGNGAHKLLPRHPNYLWDQLANDALYASFIADGFHLPESVIRVILRMKPKTSFLVSDVVSLGGLPPGRYKSHIGGDVVLTPAGKLQMADNPSLLAGSVSTLLQGVTHLAKLHIVPFTEAWDLASVQPQRYIHPNSNPGLVEGELANIVCFLRRETKVVVEQVYIEGKVMFSR